MNTVVIKLGGSSFEELAALLDFVQSCSASRVVLVHGGGPQINAMLARLGHTPVFHQGQRVTDETTLEVVIMVLAGVVNKQIVATAQLRGLKAVGLCGIDGGTLQASLYQDGALGHVGEIDLVDPLVLEGLIAQGLLPVLAPLALGPGGKALNVNADMAAASVAIALKAQRLVFLTNVDGLLDGQGQTISTVTAAEVDALIADGVIGQGMIPKMESALKALHGGVGQVEIRKADGGSGTVVTAAQRS